MRQIPRYLPLLFAATLTACEGTWATPNEIDLKPAGHSKISGIALITASAAGTVNLRYARPGSDIDAQFQQLHDAQRYLVVVRKVNCAAGAGKRIDTFSLTANSQPSEGIEGREHVDIPIHRLLSGGYSMALVERTTGKAISCGDLKTDRAW